MTATDNLLGRALCYQALAVGYAYPDAAQRERMGRLLSDLRHASLSGASACPPTVAGLAVSLEADDHSAVEADFNRLFSGEVACAPHETAYEPDIFRRQRALADITGFHTAFDLDLPEDSRWQPDHIGVELELCAVLLQRQLHALEQGWIEPAQVSEQALRSFLGDHLGRWYAAFAQRLQRTASSPFYRRLAQATDDWVERELARWQLRPVPLADRPRSAADDEPPGCGGCPADPPTRN